MLTDKKLHCLICTVPRESLHTHQCLDLLSNQDPSPSIAQFGQQARSRKGPGCFKLHPLRITEAKCSYEL